MEYKILNVGCGEDTYGTHRIDFFKTKTTTEVVDLNYGFPYESNYFDELYCKSVLEHIKNLDIFIKECYRVLKIGGKIWIRTDHAGFIGLYLIKRHEHNKAYEGVYVGHEQLNSEQEDRHYHLFVESHLKYLFKDFKDLKFNYFYGASNLFKICLYKMMPKHTGACHIELKGIKCK